MGSMYRNIACRIDRGRITAIKSNAISDPRIAFDIAGARLILQFRAK